MATTSALHLPNLRHPAKCDRVAEQLRHWISEQKLPPGERILAHSELARLFHVTRPTLLKALDTLTRERLLFRVRGKGTFLSAPTPGRRPLSLCLALPMEGSANRESRPNTWHIYQRIFDAFLGLLNDGGGSFNTTTVPEGGDLDKIAAELERHDAILFTGIRCYRNLIDRLVERRARPVVLFGDRGPAPLRKRCLNVYYNRPETARRAVAYLADCGYCRIAAIVSDETTGPEKLAGYRQALAEYALPFRKEYVISGIRCMADAARGASILVQRKLDCDAVFVDTDQKALRVIQYLGQVGIRVPDDLGVMGYDGAGDLLANPIRLSTVRVPYQSMAEAVVRELPNFDPTKGIGGKVVCVGDVLPGDTTRRALPVAKPREAS